MPLRIEFRFLSAFLLLFVQAAAAVQMPALSGADVPIWTDRPVKVDRAKQTYERIPGFSDLYTTKFRVPKNVRVHDAASFTVDDRFYIVANVIPIDPRKLCHKDDGAIFACGMQSRASLKKLINGRYLECSATSVALKINLLDCRIGLDSVAETIVSSGFGRSAVTGHLLDLQTLAMDSSRGIWADPRCRLSGVC